VSAICFSFGFMSFSAQAAPVYFDLISPLNCTVRNQKLEKCSIPQMQIQNSGVRSLGIPLKTTLEVICSGDCCSPYPLSLDVYQIGDQYLGGSHLLSANVPVLRETKLSIRDDQLGPIGDLVIKDRSQWTRLVSTHDSCRSQLKVDVDIPDIGSKEEALGHVRRIVHQLDIDIQAKENASDLASYSELFKVLRAFTEETQSSDHQVMQDLVDHSEQYIALLDRIKNEGQVSLRRDEKRALTRLKDFIEDLQDEEPTARLELTEYFTSEDRRTYERLVSGFDEPLRYQEALDLFTSKVDKTCQNLIQLKVLLNNWMEQTDWNQFDSVLEACEMHE
jgi:hypothetical protein